jgi:hypothetical protein
MRDMDETRVRQELFELVRDVDVAPGLERRTIKRARKQRVLNATLSVVLAVGVIAGVAVGASSVLSTDRTPTIGGGDETPAPPAAVSFQGIWPEIDAAGLADTQAQADDGHQPLRTDPVGTAQLLAVNVFGWPPDEVGADAVDVRGDRATVNVVNPTFGDPVPPITVELAQLGRTGPNGVWSVTDVSSPLIEVERVDALDDGSVAVAGRLPDTFLDPTRIPDSWAPTGITVEVITDPSQNLAMTGVTGETLPIAETWESTTKPVDNPAILWVRIVDAQGRALGATAISLPSRPEAVPSPTPSASVSEPSPVQPPAVDVTAVPAATGETARLIYDGVLDLDFALLASLLDPMTFVYNFDDGSNPIPEWRSDPTVLDPIPAILALPPAEPRDIEGYGTFYIWPYLVDTDFSRLTDREREDLAGLGFSEREIESMADYGGYLGPRLAIDENGLWRNYITGGD